MKKLVVIFTVLLMLSLFTRTIHAEGLSLGIFPSIIEIQATPPSSPETTVSIQNFEDLPVELRIQLLPIKTTGEKNGTIEYVPDNEDSLPQAIKSKIQILDNGKKINRLTLAPNETRDLTININLDKGDPAGDYYFSLVFLSEGIELSDTNASQIPAGIGTNILVSIGPKLPSTGVISEFKTKPFFSSGPVPFTLLLQNDSSHLIVPTGSITIKNLFGKKIANIKILPQYVLANSERYLVDANQVGTNEKLLSEVAKVKATNPIVFWPEKFLFGYYKATVDIKLDENGSSNTASTSFFAFPTYLYFVLIILIFVAVSIYLRVKRKI